MLRVFLAVVALVAVGCGVDSPTTAPTPMPAHGTPSRIELNASSGTGANGGTATVQARVIDAYAAALPAVTVAFHASAGDLTAASVVTDGNGFARTTLTGSAGTVSIEAQAATVRADVTVTVQPLVVNPAPPPGPPPPPEPPPLVIPFAVAITAGVDPKDLTAPPHTLVFGLTTQTTVVNAVWNFGDNTGTFTTIGSRAASARHTYTAPFPPTVNVTVTATDSRGRVASDVVGVIVP